MDAYVISDAGIDDKLLCEIGTGAGPKRRPHGSAGALEQVGLVYLGTPELLQLLQPAAEHRLDTLVYLGGKPISAKAGSGKFSCRSSSTVKCT